MRHDVEYGCARVLASLGTIKSGSRLNWRGCQRLRPFNRRLLKKCSRVRLNERAFYSRGRRTVKMRSEETWSSILSCVHPQLKWEMSLPGRDEFAYRHGKVTGIMTGLYENKWWARSAEAPFIGSSECKWSKSIRFASNAAWYPKRSL